MNLTTAQRDRVAGVLLGTAVGDALGAGYEFGPPLADDAPVAMRGGGQFGWAPGEWTDDTAMAIVIARVAADGLNLRSTFAQDRIAAAWAAWSREAADVGIQTRAVLGAAGRSPSAATLAAAARHHHERTGRSAGNGSLMRTAPVALAYLDDEAALMEAATAISALTHHDPEAGEACALWCLAIRHAVRTGELDARIGLDHLESNRAAVWAQRLDEAEAHPPAHFENNGWVVHALQGAWSAIVRTPVPTEDPRSGSYRAQHLQRAVATAVRGGRDTDTVAAIAGGLLGAAWGASAVPASWRRVVHGWPGLRARDLIALADAVAGHEAFDGAYRGMDVSALARHPHDDGVWLGAVEAVRSLPVGVDAVVSLCRLRTADLPAGVEHVEVRLIDEADPSHNPHLAYVLDDTVRLIETLRGEGRTVLLHCVQAQSRTPTVAALYGARRSGLSPAAALADVLAALPSARPNSGFRRFLGGDA